MLCWRWCVGVLVLPVPHFKDRALVLWRCGALMRWWCGVLLRLWCGALVRC